MLPKRTLIEIGDRVRELRKSKGLTQERFAEVMDLSENSISQIENGKKGMSLQTLFTLCKLYETPADYILFGPQDNKDPKNIILKLSSEMTKEELQKTINYLVSLNNMKDAEEI